VDASTRANETTSSFRGRKASGMPSRSMRMASSGGVQTRSKAIR
jgi:hypothetical protein